MGNRKMRYIMDANTGKGKWRFIDPGAGLAANERDETPDMEYPKLEQ